MPHKEDSVNPHRTGQNDRRKVIVESDSSLPEEVVSARQRKAEQYEEGRNQRNNAGDHHRAQQNVEDDLMPSESDFRECVRRKRAEEQVREHARARRNQAVQKHSEKRNFFEYPCIMLDRETARKQRYGKLVNFVVCAERSYERPIERKAHYDCHEDENQIQQRFHGYYAHNPFFSVPIRGIAFGVDFE